MPYVAWTTLVLLTFITCQKHHIPGILIPKETVNLFIYGIFTHFLSSLHCSDQVCPGTSCTFRAKDGRECENGRVHRTGTV